MKKLLVLLLICPLFVFGYNKSTLKITFSNGEVYKHTANCIWVYYNRVDGYYEHWLYTCGVYVTHSCGTKDDNYIAICDYGMGYASTQEQDYKNIQAEIEMKGYDCHYYESKTFGYYDEFGISLKKEDVLDIEIHN